MPKTQTLETPASEVAELREQIAEMQQKMAALQNANNPSPRVKGRFRRRGASAERTQELTALIQAWLKKSSEWSDDEGATEAPGGWYYFDLIKVIQFAANGPVPAGFVRTFRALREAGKAILKQFLRRQAIADQAPSGNLDMAVQGLAASFGAEDDEEVFSAKELILFKKMGEALAAGMDRDFDEVQCFLDQLQVAGLRS